MRVTRGNQSTKYCTTGDNGDGFETGGGLVTVIALEAGGGLEEVDGFCAYAIVESATQRTRAVAATATRTGACRGIVNNIFIAQPLCHDAGVVTSTMAERSAEAAVRRARLARGLTQDDLARRAGLS